MEWIPESAGVRGSVRAIRSGRDLRAWDSASCHGGGHLEQLWREEDGSRLTAGSGKRSELNQHLRVCYAMGDESKFSYSFVQYQGLISATSHISGKCLELASCGKQ